MFCAAAVASRRLLQTRSTHDVACSVGGFFLVSRHAHVALAHSTTPSSKNPTRRHAPAALFTPIPPRLGYAHVSVRTPPENAGTDQNGHGAGCSRTLNFSDSGWVFCHKSTRELLRGLIVLNMCSIDPLVNHSYKLLTVGERLVGPRMLGWLVAPFYNQFVAGETEEDLGRTSQRLAQNNVRLMVAPMLETDVGEGHDTEELYAKNLKKTVSLIEQSRRQSVLEGARPFCQTKHTAHLTADFLTRMSNAYLTLDFPGRVAAVEVVAGLMVEAGEAGDEWQLSNKSLHPLNLNPSDTQEVLQCLPRLHQIGRTCTLENVVLTVDAEFTFTNPAINLLTLAMMKVFNPPTAPPIIWNTYQGYLKAGVENLKEDLRVVERLGDGNVGFGAKIVRGAYLERERERAAELAYPDPINDTYEDTGRTYDRMVEVMLGEVSRATRQRRRQVIVASHNEASVTHAASTVNHLGLDPTSGDVVFGQVYGMAENISIPLAASGLLVYKSVPIGNMSEVLPYLSRRAAENRAILKGARLEKRLVKEELQRRLFLRRQD